MEADDEWEDEEWEPVPCEEWGCECGSRYCVACPGCGDYFGGCGCPVTVYLIDGGSKTL
ncbi:hypothetical protein ABZT26_35330 [Streptomyces sp. NPDC005395]|uniref:hypothetical protein n=1 Tax=Streptomyces sp. NPDC005395 TaxID=3157042 RepID=UPI0033AD6503